MNFHSFRKTDVGLILTVILIVGALWAGVKKPLAWDETVDRVRDLEPRVEKVEKDMVELRSINTTQMSMIIRELDTLHRDVKRYRGESRSDARTQEIAKE